jgi:hypothetical protein
MPSLPLCICVGISCGSPLPNIMQIQQRCSLWIVCEWRRDGRDLHGTFVRKFDGAVFQPFFLLSCTCKGTLAQHHVQRSVTGITCSINVMCLGWIFCFRWEVCSMYKLLYASINARVLNFSIFWDLNPPPFPVGILSRSLPSASPLRNPQTRNVRVTVLLMTLISTTVKRQQRFNHWIWMLGAMLLIGENWNTRRKTYYSATLSTTNTEWT